MTVRPWVAHHRPTQAANLRLVCLPYAGGGASVYRAWADDLPATIEVWPIELPGRETRFNEPAYARLEPLVADLSEALGPSLASAPFALFGHSMGALIAFELATRLGQEHGLAPVHLFASAHRAPHLPDRNRPSGYLSDEHLLARIRALGGTPPAVLEHPELLEIVLPILRADFGIVHDYDYAPRPRVPCAITAFGGVADREVTRDDLEAWAGQTSARFELHMLAGDHFFLQQASRRVLLDYIAAACAAAV